MSMRNTEKQYGWISIMTHWLMALVIFTLFGVGLWMVDMDYDNPWYRTAPHWHKSIGVLLVGALILRFIWRMTNPRPAPIHGHKTWEKRLSNLVQYAFYVLIVLMFPSGYFITTAKGQGLDIFDWFTIPSIVQGVENMADYAGDIHEWIAFVIIGLAVLHIAGALKHHFIDKDRTLKRMLKSGT